MTKNANVLFVAETGVDQTVTLQRALAMTKGAGGRLTLFDVVDPLEEAEALRAKLNLDLQELLVQRRLDELKQLIANAGAHANEIKCRVAVGRRFMEIIRSVLREGYDLVVKTGQEAGGPLARLFGSDDLHLLRKCPCPVWIDRQRPEPQYRCVLAAVDPLEECGPDLARQVLQTARFLADTDGAQLHVAHAWRLPNESTLRNSGLLKVRAEDIDQLEQSAFARHSLAVQALLADEGLQIDNSSIHLPKGLPAAAIAECARSVGADIIVMGTVGRTGVSGLFMGNTAENVLQNTQLPVWAIKPTGFVSPVTL